MTPNFHHLAGQHCKARAARPLLRASASQDAPDLGNTSPEAASGAVNEAAQSALVNEETVYFIFQLDLDTQLQRCLNQEAYAQAQEVRTTRQRVSRRKGVAAKAGMQLPEYSTSARSCQNVLPGTARLHAPARNVLHHVPSAEMELMCGGVSFSAAADACERAQFPPWFRVETCTWMEGWVRRAC